MKKSVQLGKTNFPIEGRFRLDVRRDPKKFSLTNINSFVPNGKTAADRMYLLTDSGETDSLFLDRVSVLFDPRKQVDNHNIAVFIQHPDVMIGGMSPEEHQQLVNKGLKNDNPTFMITNVDKAELEIYDQEVSILKVRAKLYNDDKPIKKEALIWICSNFGIPYYSDITDSERYLNDLRKKIDKYVSSSAEAAAKIDVALNEMAKTEMVFYINELMAAEIITNFGGVYKIEDRPIGGGIDHLISFYDQNPEILTEHKKIVKNRLGSILN